MTIRLCQDESDFDAVADDYDYWEADIGWTDDEDEEGTFEYNEWVRKCESLDLSLTEVIGEAVHVIDDITQWRVRCGEVPPTVVSRQSLHRLQQLLVGEFADWRIILHVWADRVPVGRLLLTEGEIYATADTYPLAIR